MRVSNWAGNHAYPATAWHEPTSIDELCEIVAAAPRIRALGSGHCFNDIVDSDALVSLDHLPTVMEIDRRRATVTVTGSVRYGTLATHLHANGWAVHNLASLPHITVAGAIATATHGSGDRHPNLAAVVNGLDLVTANGDVRHLDASAPGFRGSVVGLGALGVVTAVTLEIEPTYDVAQEVHTGLPWSAALEHFDAITASADSVSLFTDWTGPQVAQVCGARAASSRSSGGRRTCSARSRRPVPCTPCRASTRRAPPSSSASQARGTSACRTSGWASRPVPVPSSSRSIWWRGSMPSRRWRPSGAWPTGSLPCSWSARSARSLPTTCGCPPPTTGKASASTSPGGRRRPRSLTCCRRWRTPWPRSTRVRTGGSCSPTPTDAWRTCTPGSVTSGCWPSGSTRMGSSGTTTSSGTAWCEVHRRAAEPGSAAARAEDVDHEHQRVRPTDTGPRHAAGRYRWDGHAGVRGRHPRHAPPLTPAPRLADGAHTRRCRSR